MECEKCGSAQLGQINGLTGAVERFCLSCGAVQSQRQPDETAISKYEKHRQITTQMSEIYKAKNQDYGDSFGKSVQAHGLIAAVVRLEDKMNRIASLVKSGKAEVKSESLTDTLIDMANYAIMTVIEMGEKK